MQINAKQKLQLQRIHILSVAAARANIANRLGLEYGGDRDVYEALGYKKQLEYSDFSARYYRQDIARAVIDKPVDASWQGGFVISESTKENETALEKAWNTLSKDMNLNVLSNLKRLDKLVGIGEYGVLLFGLDDVKNVTDFARPVPNRAKLLYLRPLSEGSATIARLDEDTSSPRYGLPLFYNITLSSVTGAKSSFNVHYSRVLHVAGELLEGTLKGQSRLEPIYNRLVDLEKLVGGSAEMFWRGARPGYAGKVDPEYTLTEDDEDEFQNQLDEYEHNLRRFLISKGIDINALNTQVSDPSHQVDVQIQMISAQTGIPKRILTGSERGELASSEDVVSWNSLIENRRSNFVEPEIIRPFIDRCITVGVLPPAITEEGYEIVWNKPMFEQSAKEKADIGEIRARALKEYASQPTAENVIPPDAFYQYFLGLSQEQIDTIKTIQEAAMKEEAV